MPGFNIGGSGDGPSNKDREFHRNHRWIIEDLGVPMGGMSTGSGTSTGGNAPGSSGGTGRTVGPTQTRSNSGPPTAAPGGGGGASALALYAQSIQLPELEFEEETINSANLVYKVAKRAKWKPCVVKFYDVYGLYKIFNDWQKKIWDETKGIQEAKLYKGRPIFKLVDGQGSTKQKYTLINAYPVSISHGSLSYTNSDIKLLEVTYSYDFAQIDIQDSGG